jgi:hypothetical protein
LAVDDSVVEGADVDDRRMAAEHGIAARRYGGADESTFSGNTTPKAVFISAM